MPAWLGNQDGATAENTIRLNQKKKTPRLCILFNDRHFSIYRAYDAREGLPV